MTDISKQIKKDLFSANRRIERLESFIKSIQLDSVADDVKREKLLEEKW